MKHVVIIGAGPTGLFASSLLLGKGYSVDLYDQMSQAGRKLLLAGKSGLNITNNKDAEIFYQAYGSHEKEMKPSLSRFTPTDLRYWLSELGIKTFEGSTGSVFPNSLKATELLRLWMEKLNSYSTFKFYPDHKLIKIEEKIIYFNNNNKTFQINAPVLIMGMGGASYPSTGSNGEWLKQFKKLGIKTYPFKPMNCGFEYSWTSVLKAKFNNSPLKNISITLNNKTVRGEIIITSYGIEGAPVYILSREIRETIDKAKSATVHIDLVPDLCVEKVLLNLNKNKGKNSLSNHLRKRLNLPPIKTALFRELANEDVLNDFCKLSQTIKKLPLTLEKPRPIEEAISTSGGVSFEELNEYFMLKKYPGWFAAGEMVDWDAPTGGFLLQGCFSTAFTAVEGIQRFFT
jgi:uncharacterized flavoprotein (TIGR03862 family)